MAGMPLFINGALPATTTGVRTDGVDAVFAADVERSRGIGREHAGASAMATMIEIAAPAAAVARMRLTSTSMSCLTVHDTISGFWTATGPGRAAAGRPGVAS